MKNIRQYIHAAIFIMLLAVPAASHAQNTWVRKTTYTSSGGGSSFTDVTYYDGLGYPIQEQAVGASTGGGAIVRPIVYDSMRRDDATVYLPFAAPADSSGFLTDAVAAQRAFYSSRFGDTDACSTREYESSPVGRVTSAMREGHEYRQGSGHRMHMSYSTNGTADAVKRFRYVYPAGSLTTGAITVVGNYPASSLAKVTSVDEDSRRTDTYSTPSGRLICSRTWLDSSDYLETHYVYDLKDSLVCVIQPEGMDRLVSTTTVDFDDDFASRYCFLYRYDGEGRVIESQVPGGGVSEYAYDARGRLVAYASAEMAAHRRYRITGYDTLDRIVEEYYVSFIRGTDAEALRSVMKTWDGTESSLPMHLMVRKTYSAVYYPFQTSGGGSGGHGHLDPEPFDPSDTLIVDPHLPFNPFINGSPGAAGLMSVGATGTTDLLAFAADAIVTADMLDTTHNKGLLKEETVSSVPGIDGSISSADTLSVTRRYYYDYRGNVIQMRELSSDGWSGSCSTSYDFAGNVTGTLESHTSPSGETHNVKTDLTLDPRGNVLSERIYADGSLVSETEYDYDELMRPVGRTTGNLTETVTLDLRGWRTASEVKRGNSTIYSQSLSYMSPSQGVTPRWSGLISEATTTHFGNSANTFAYEYDNAGRLTAALSQRGGESGISYDGNGNMLSLQRRRNSSSLVANLAMTYDGNRLSDVTDSGTEHPGSFVFDYDESGNMTSDSRKSLEISSNVLNLPMAVSETAGTTVTNTMTYTYLGDGTKVGAMAGSPDAGGHTGMRYRGSFVYDVTGTGGQTLQSIAVSTGRLIAVTGNNGSVSFESDGFITDHLGNVAAVVNLSAPASTSTANFILEQNDYLPFGSRIALKEQSSNRYRYAGKEEQDIAGMDLGLLDFGARYYDAYVGRWNAIDPLAEKYFGMSPYNYCGNDPVNRFDPEGKEIKFSDDCSEEFKERVLSIIKYLIDNECGQQIQDIQNSKQYTLTITESNKSAVDPLRHELKFNANQMMSFSNGQIMVSPAVELAHEMDHVFRHMTDPDNLAKDSMNKIPDYRNSEEKRVITGTEQTVAKALNEIDDTQVTRSDHKGEYSIGIGNLTNEHLSHKAYMYNHRIEQIQSPSIRLYYSQPTLIRR